MTATEQHRNTTSVICIGESLWDNLMGKCVPGGAPANVASHLSQLGLDSILLSRLGNDEAGISFRNEMQSRNVNTSLLQMDSIHLTCTVSVKQSENGDTSFCIPTGTSWDYFERDAAWVTSVETSGIIYFGTLAMRSEFSREIILGLLQAAKGKILFCDINLRPPHFEETIIRSCLTFATALKVNEGELHVLSGLLDLDGHSLSSRSRQLMMRFGIKLMCVSLGSNGCMVISEEEEFLQRPYKAEAIDSTGAGDAYTSGIIYGLTHHWSLNKSAYFASILGARVVEKSGPNSLTPEDYVKALSIISGEE